MEKGEQPAPFIEVVEISEDVRIYSTSYLNDNWAKDVVPGILQHPWVESVTPELGKPKLSLIISVEDPRHWDKYIDPFCREMISAAIEGQDLHR
jgi:hypothetical protein